MKGKICVYTCITGDYDNLHEIEVFDKNVDYLCFTNNKKLTSKTWKIIYIKNDGLDNHHLSRRIKMIGHPIISKNYDISVWVDASVVWEKKASDFVNTYLTNSLFATFKHSQRNSIHDEAIACLKYNKDTKENILKTLDFLDHENFPDSLGLYEMTVFAKYHNDKTVKDTMKLWFEINTKYSKRDQLGFMYAIWKTGLKVTPINLSVWDNPWFHTIPHTKESNITQCSIYFGDSSSNYSFDNFQTNKYDQSCNHYSTSFIIPHDTQRLEIEPFDTIGVLCKNLDFSIKPEKIESPTTIPYINYSFYNEYDKFILTDNFKKGQKINISFDARLISRSELIIMTKNLMAENIKNFNIIHDLNKQLSETNERLSSIQNSKSWKLIQKTKRMIKRSK